MKLPLRFLEGERVYAHSRILWGIFYLLTLEEERGNEAVPLGEVVSGDRS